MTKSKAQISNKSFKSQIPIWSFVIGILFVICHWSFVIPAFAGDIGQGGQEIAVLKAGVGARALGMGGAFISIADNADAPYWNPAGLARVKNYEITTMQTKLSSDADHYYVSYVMPFMGGGLGLSWIQVGLGSITQTSNTTDAFNDVETLGIFSYYSNAYLVGYGLGITDNLSVGITAKYLTSDMPGLTSAGGNAYGYSATVGLLYKPISNLSIGFKVDEIANYQRWGTETEETAPSKYRLGVSYLMSLYNYPLLLSSDISQINMAGYAAEASGGAELTVGSLILRIGSADSVLTAGAGLRTEHIGIDYAYVTQTDLSKDNVHRVGLSGYW